MFASRDFRHYWLASVAFGVGVWAFLTVMGWTALELTDSTFKVSLVNVVYFLPMFLFALPAGVLADRWDRRWTAIISRGACAVIMLVMAWLAQVERLTYPLLLSLSFFVGLSIISELAARQALLAQIVPPGPLVNATALTAVQGGLARVAGPLLAGVLVDWVGDGGGYGLFAAMNLLFVYFFLRIQPLSSRVDASHRAPVQELKDGFAYLRTHDDARAIVAIGIATGMVGWLYIALMPIMARDVLEGTATTLGALGMAAGLGSVPGALVLSFIRDFRYEGRVFILAMVLWGVGILAFAFSRSVPLAIASVTLAGLGFGVQVILVRSILLRIVEPRYHGRVLGVLMLTWGSNILGTLFGGSVADAIGVTWVIAGSGALIVGITGMVLASNRQLWHL